MRPHGAILLPVLFLCGGCHLSLPYSPSGAQDDAAVRDLVTEDRDLPLLSDLTLPADIGRCPDGQRQPLFHSSFEDPGFGPSGHQAVQQMPGPLVARSGVPGNEHVGGPKPPVLAADQRLAQGRGRQSRPQAATQTDRGPPVMFGGRGYRAQQRPGDGFPNLNRS